MEKINNASIVLSFLALWLTSFISGELEIIIGFILIFSFGILHGSNDLLLIESLKSKNTNYSFYKTLGAYLAVVLAAVSVFYFIPMLALILFIIFSAYHFGEQHWEHQNLGFSKIAEISFYLLYGNFVLLFLFIFNQQEVIDVVASISGTYLKREIITHSFIANSIVLGIVMLVFAFKSKSFRKNSVKELFFLLIFGVLFKISTLIWGFTIYFIFWHSIPSLYEQVNFIYGDYSKKSIFNYFKNAFVYWIISLVGIAGVYLIFKDEKIFYALFFSFIAAVTFPHSIVISQMFKNKKTQSN